MTAILSIYHRIDQPFEEFNGTTILDDLRFAHAYSVVVPVAAETEDGVDLAETAFAACGNAPYRISGWEAVQDAHQRARRRSLSVGDIVVVDRPGPTLGTRHTAAFAVRNAGWKRVPVALTRGRFVTDYPVTH
jgi:hypothetical protein